MKPFEPKDSGNPFAAAHWRMQWWLNRTMTLRHWRRDWRQTLVLIFTLSLGVAAFLSIRMANRAAVDGFAGFLEPVGGNSDWIVRAAQGPLQLSDLQRLQQAAMGSWQPFLMVPVLEATANLPGQSTNLRILGLDLLGMRNLDPKAEGLRVLGQGDGFWDNWQNPRALFISPQLARAQSVSVGSGIILNINGRDLELQVAGILQPVHAGPSIPPNLVVMDLPVLQKWTGRSGQVDRVEIFSTGPAADVDAVRAHLEKFRPQHWRIDGLETALAEGERMTAAFRMNLQVLSLIALLAGLFLLGQAMDSAVVKRRQEIAILRSLGMTPGDIARNWWLQILVLGLAGSIGGLLLGWAMAQFTVTAVAQTINALYQSSSAEAAALAAEDIFIAFILGMGGAVIGGWLPLRDARNTPPAQVLSLGNWSPGGKWLRSSVWALAALPIGWILAQWSPIELASGKSFPLYGHLAALLWLVGGAILAGFCVRLTGYALGCQTHRSVPRLLAASRLRNASSRHRLAAAGLFVATAMAAAMVLLIASFERTVVSWLQVRLQADIYLTSSATGGADSLQTIPRDTIEALHAQPGIRLLDTFRSVSGEWQGRPYLLTASDFSVLQQVPNLLWRETPLELDLKPAAADGVAIINERFASLFNTQVGELIQLPVASGSKTLWIRAVQADYSSDRPTLLIDQANLHAWLGINDATNVTLFLHAGYDAEAVVGQLREAFPGLTIRDQTGLLELALGIFHQTFAVTEALKFLALLVAVSGLALALISILRENLFALRIQQELGMTRRESALAAAWEGFGIALAGTVCGLLMAFALGWLMIYVINFQSFGWTLQFTVPFGSLLRFILLLLLTNTVVAYLCGRKTARLG